ncbi:nitroreductase family protein [Bacteroidota bacterium]
MKFIELAKIRQSVRKYSDQSVDREKIELCLEAARIAPSASNSQPWYFIVVDEPELKEKVAKETFGTIFSFNHFTMQSPVLIVVITEKSKTITRIGQKIKNKIYNQYDVGIASEHFCLQAAELGLGTCLLGWFNEKKLKKVLSMPDNKQIDMIITLGYPADNKIRNKIRRSIDEIRSYNKYK